MVGGCQWVNHVISSVRRRQVVWSDVKFTHQTFSSLIRCQVHWANVVFYDQISSSLSKRKFSDQMSSSLIRCQLLWSYVKFTEQMSSSLIKCQVHWVNVKFTDQMLISLIGCQVHKSMLILSSRCQVQSIWQVHTSGEKSTNQRSRSVTIQDWAMPRGRPHVPWLRQVVLSDGHGHGGPGVCLGDGQTEAEWEPSQGGRGDALVNSINCEVHRPDVQWPDV